MMRDHQTKQLYIDLLGSNGEIKGHANGLYHGPTRAFFDRISQ